MPLNLEAVKAEYSVVMEVCSVREDTGSGALRVWLEGLL